MQFPVELAWEPVRLPVHLRCETLTYDPGLPPLPTCAPALPTASATTAGSELLVGAAAGSLLGLRLLGLLEHLALLLRLPGSWLYYATNKTIVGGLMGVELVKKRLGITASLGNLMVFPLLLGPGIGRVGCLLGGLKDGTFGTAAALPSGINFGDGVARHPTNICEILFLGPWSVAAYCPTARASSYSWPGI